MEKNFIIVIIILLLVVGVYIFKNKEETGNFECELDSDCVPKEACHPTSCVLKGQEDSRDGFFCTEFCEPGTLDCGQGYCSCVKGECEAVIGE